MFEEMPDSIIVTNKGPKMTINGWMQYFRGTEYWDPWFHRRTFVILVHAMFKGVLTGTMAAMNMKIDKLHKVTTDVPQTKKAKEQTLTAIKAAGKNQVHTMAIVMSEDHLMSGTR